jgi:hypothetical protein
MTARAFRAVVVSVAAVVVVAGCGIVGGSPAPASPAPTTARAALPAGDYASSAFRPAASFTLPEGWLVAGDGPDFLSLQPATSDAVGVYLFRSPKAASQDPACPVAPAQNVGATAADLVAWIVALPGLVVSEPVPVTLGGLSGQQLDAHIVDGWTASCPFADGLPTVPLFVGASDQSFRWVVAGNERLRLAVLDVPGQGTVVVDIDAFDGTLMDDLLVEATPIVESLRFGLP